MNLPRHRVALFHLLQVVGLSIVLSACGGGSSGVAATAFTPSASSTSSTSSTTSGGSPTGTTTGTMSLQWTAPVTRTDGTPLSLSEIAGYRVHYGTAPGSYPHHVDITDGSLQSATLTGMPVGTYYVAMSTYDSNGLESSYSASVVKDAI